MTRGLGRLSGAAALLTALLVATPASPAGAAEGDPPKITIDSPRADPPLTSETVTVSGQVAVDGLIYRPKDVTLVVGSDTKTIVCTESPCPFSWRLTRPLNGPYQVKATATQAAIILGTAGPSSEAVRRFAVAAPPAKPTLDPPKVTDARTVELSWTRNTEPDMLYYAVFRKDPGAADFRQVGGKVPHPSTGTKVTFTDTTAPPTAGDYAYQVVAVRRGASGTADTEASSDPSGSTRAALPAGAPGSPGSSSTIGNVGGFPGTDLSGFLSSRAQPTPLPTITIPEPPDTGFDATLPFGARPPGEQLEEGEPDAVPPRGQTTVTSRVRAGRPLVPVAAGLVLLLLALHMRVLNRRIKAGGDNDLPVDLDVRSPRVEPAGVTARPAVATAVSARPAPVVDLEPEPPPEPRTQFYDVLQESDWAPVAVAAPAPEPEPEPEWEPDPEPSPAPEPETQFYDVLQEADWAPVAADTPPETSWQQPVDESYDEPELDVDVDPEEIEVFEVVSPARRPLARSGSR